MPRYGLLLAALLALPAVAYGASHVGSAPVPAEMRSTAFTLTVNGHPVGVAHAAASLEYASFDMTGPVDVEITAAEPGFWDPGVDIQPWRLGLRARRAGQTIRFHLAAPAKLSISRPGDFLNHAAMLFLFAGAPPPPLPRKAVIHAYQPGVYHQSLNPQSGETLYLAPGSYFYGSLNLWNVHDVTVLGRGTIVYDGPQDPNSDEGWMQKPDWHCIGAMNAHRVEIDGLTCIVRSRTWSIQMKDSTDFVYNDLRVMGGNPGNANQDGMDWLGGGDTIVRNAFLRASDDDFALQGNWDGYTDADLARPGHNVENILIENSELSTSISNSVRAGWPRKIYNSHNFTLKDSDILHGGIGACGQTFGLFSFWDADGAQGDHSDYTFENLFLDNWYSLVQMEQEYPGLHGFTFRNIWALDQPPLADSTLIGDVAGVTLENVKYGQKRAEADANIPLVVSGGAAASLEYASFDMTGPVDVEITAAEPGFWDPGVDIQPWRLGLRARRAGQTIRFHLAAPAKLSISRPGDFLNHAAMLFLFAGAPPPPLPRKAVIHAYQPGVYHQSLNPQSGETLYLAPGSYFYGSLNLWNVHDVTVLGRGTIVYDGPQDPNSDEGWMQKPDWHCIGAMNAHRVEIDGLTCIVRSRTWSIQMKDSTDFVYNDLRVMGGNPGNANQDGMDWLGGGDTIVRNAFLRASDDDFALQGNWDGYTDADLARPGHNVENILIENSELSTSISNSVRAGWPRRFITRTTLR